MAYKNLHTLQISSPWNPPATIKFSFTVIVLICTLDNDWDESPGRFCSRDHQDGPIISKVTNLLSKQNFKHPGPA